MAEVATASDLSPEFDRLGASLISVDERHALLAIAVDGNSLDEARRSRSMDAHRMAQTVRSALKHVYANFCSVRL